MPKISVLGRCEERPLTATDDSPPYGNVGSKPDQRLRVGSGRSVFRRIARSTDVALTSSPGGQRTSVIEPRLARSISLQSGRHT